jgi:sulfite reductase beta subunit-like hemoprotein
MNLGDALEDAVRAYDDPVLRDLQINVSGCPNACGQHWTAEIGFYGNARKIDGKEVPHYQMLLGGGYDEQGVMRFGLQIMSLPARFAPVAMRRVLDHYKANHREGETFRNYVLRHKVEFFRKELLADLTKPPLDQPEMFRDWGDEEDFSLKLGRGECAA